jgi:integral membrane sensor domain MASE1
MERLVRAVVGGGLLLVAGLWLAVPFSAGSPPWLLGAALAALGVVGLAFGIGSEIRAV